MKAVCNWIAQLEPVKDFISKQTCRLEPPTLLKMIFWQTILKDFVELWVNSDKHLLYMRYFIGLLQLLKTFTKTLGKKFVL